MAMRTDESRRGSWFVLCCSEINKTPGIFLLLLLLNDWQHSILSEWTKWMIPLLNGTAAWRRQHDQKDGLFLVLSSHPNIKYACHPNTKSFEETNWPSSRVWHIIQPWPQIRIKNIVLMTELEQISHFLMWVVWTLFSSLCDSHVFPFLTYM